MKAFITGGTGFVGTYLTGRLIDLGWDVVITGRAGKSVYQKESRLKIISCDTKIKGAWQEDVAGADLIINLAGKNIFTIWSLENYKQIEESRIITTRNLVDAIPNNSKSLLFSTSAAGYYGNRGELVLDEKADFGKSELAKLCNQWEAEAYLAEQKGCRIVIMRFGMVLGKGGGALKMMLTPFRFFLGGSVGKGDNWVSWIHLEDLVSAILFIITNNKVKGPVNFCSPNPVRHRELTKSLANVLGRPSIFTIPSFIVKKSLGGLGDELLSSQRMSSEKLQDSGFEFKFADINTAFKDLLKPS